jgi:hypothetical protein
VSLLYTPSYAIYVDSLRMAGGATYVVVKGETSTPVSYAAGAFAFDQAPRYKQVRSVFLPGWWCTAIPPLPRRTHLRDSFLRRRDVCGHV